MSGSMVLLRPGSVLMSVAHGTNKGYMDVQGLCHNSLVSEGHAVTKVITIWVGYTITRDHGGFQAQAAAVGHVWDRYPAAARV